MKRFSLEMTGRWLTGTAVVLLAASCTSGGSEWTLVAAGARQDLEQALEELARVRSEVEEQRLPLVRELRRWEEELAQRRTQLERARRTADNELVELNVLRAEARTRSNELAAVEGLLGNYYEAFAGRLHPAEAGQYESVLRAFSRARAADVAPPAERLAAQLVVLEAGLARMERLLAGDVWEGKALAPNGELVEGQFVMLGPLVWFAATGDQGPAGVVQVRLNAPAPELVRVGSGAEEGIRQVVLQRRGQLPVDPTLGHALKLQATRDSLWTHIRKGGPVMVPILLLGGVAVGIFVWKWRQISRVPVASPEEVQSVLAALNEGNPDRALAEARALPGPVGRMLEAAVAHWREPKEYVEEVLYEKMLALRPRLERGLSFLALAAAAAPLLGLLGTVTGMINTFNVITVFGTGDPKLLAGGISEALITTEFGLIVAIPSLLLHALLSRRLKALLGEVEQISVSFLNGLPERHGTAPVSKGLDL